MNRRQFLELSTALGATLFGGCPHWLQIELDLRFFGGQAIRLAVEAL